MNKQNLIKILSIQTASYKQWRMFAYIIRELKKIDCTFYVDKGNIYASKGKADFFPCIVAHMDTVHSIESDLTVLQIGNNLTGFNKHKMKQAGIGGDDKVGIFIALELFRLFKNMKIAFFVNEEIGCGGSRQADKKFFKDCGYVLQCDRKGNGDFVTKASGVKLSSKAFLKDTAKTLFDFGYETTTGLMTDVMALKELKINCSMANMSCGYYNPHSDSEYVNISDVENCLEFVRQLIHRLGKKYYPHTYVAKPFTTFTGNGKFDYSKWTEEWNDAHKDEINTYGDDLLYRKKQRSLNDDNNYCADCWAAPASHNGLCEKCNKYYDDYLKGNDEVKKQPEPKSTMQKIIAPIVKILPKKKNEVVLYNPEDNMNRII